jgi:hypothetical protein
MVDGVHIQREASSFVKSTPILRFKSELHWLMHLRMCVGWRL